MWFGFFVFFWVLLYFVFLVFYLFLGGGLVFSAVRRVCFIRRRFALLFCTTFYKLDFRHLKTPQKEDSRNIYKSKEQAARRFKNAEKYVEYIVFRRFIYCLSVYKWVWVGLGVVWWFFV
ncbi:MAG: hypothetical protein QXQ91_04470, partial [Nanopusillaceae archaeon]